MSPAQLLIANPRKKKMPYKQKSGAWYDPIKHTVVSAGKARQLTGLRHKRKPYKTHAIAKKSATKAIARRATPQFVIPHVLRQHPSEIRINPKRRKNPRIRRYRRNPAMPFLLKEVAIAGVVGSVIGIAIDFLKPKLPPVIAQNDKAVVAVAKIAVGFALIKFAKMTTAGNAMAAMAIQDLGNLVKEKALPAAAVSETVSALTEFPTSIPYIEGMGELKEYPVSVPYIEGMGDLMDDETISAKDIDDLL